MSKTDQTVGCGVFFFVELTFLLFFFVLVFTLFFSFACRRHVHSVTMVLAII